MLRSLRSTPKYVRSHQFKRIFHYSRILFEKTHYETLKIPTNATPDEIKKAFYTLSKIHHPDRNPSDPQASERFIALSAAYSVLSISSKRASYDLTISVKPQPNHTPRGTYSSANHAGGRSPSGLSRRRSQFRGPPPSFYRNGCWGIYSEKRRDTHQESINSSQTNSSRGTRSPNSASFDGFGPCQSHSGFDPFLNHFDTDQHFRTQENHRKRRQARDREGMELNGEKLPKGLLREFVSVAGILLVGVLLPLTIMNSVPNIR